MKEFYKKSDIIKMLEELKPVPCKIYSTLREMADAENYPENGDDYDDVESYTTYAISPPNYICAYIKGNIYPDNAFGFNELFVQFDDNDYPIGYYGFSPYGKGFEEVMAVVKTTIEYLKKNKMILYKEHPSISVEEAMRLLESDEEV